MRLLNLSLLCLISCCLSSCATSEGGPRGARQNSSNSRSNQPAIAKRNEFPVIHVFVALCDNINQGIVPVSASLGNGDNPSTNLYWGAAFGVKTFFKKSRDWELVSEIKNPRAGILERLIFRHRTQRVFLVADAYQGKEIKQTTIDFLEAAAGKPGEEISVSAHGSTTKFHTAGSADLLAYIGHDGLMDFQLAAGPSKRDDRERDAIILACASQQYFASVLKDTGASPLVWTTNLMAPEAYVLSAALDGWIRKETDEQIRARAAKAYPSYQNCGLKAANKLFVTGW